MSAMVAFTLLPLGLVGLHNSLKETAAEGIGYWALVLNLIGTGFTLPFYGAETFGLHVIGQEAISQHNAELMRMANIVRAAGFHMFVIGLILLAASAALTAIAVWKSGKYSKWSGVPFALGFLLYYQQFFWNQSLRIAHGMLVAVGCLWLAMGLLKQSKQ